MPATETELDRVLKRKKNRSTLALALLRRRRLTGFAKPLGLSRLPLGNHCGHAIHDLHDVLTGFLGVLERGGMA